MMLSLRRALCAAAFLALTAVMPHTSALAEQPIDPSTLNPPPPSFEACHAVGNGVICQGTRTLPPYGPDDTGLVCGGSPNAFDIFDSGVESQVARRDYDQNGNLVRRFILQSFVSQFSIWWREPPCRISRTARSLMCWPSQGTSARPRRPTLARTTLPSRIWVRSF
jgi:hypothetical protein